MTARHPSGDFDSLRASAMLHRALLLAAGLVLACAARADAGWFPAEGIDGPSADIVAVGDIDVARDGTGGVAYLKRQDGAVRVFVSRLAGGAWRTPERVDAGVGAEAASVTVAAADGNRLAVLWTAGGRLYGAWHGQAAEVGPLSGAQALADGASDPHADFGINGTAYGVYTAGGGDVRAVRLFENRWEGIASPLDIDPANVAGDGPGRPRIAVSADGNAVAVWGEVGPDGRRRVFGRRLTGLTPSSLPQELSLAELGGAAGGGADSVDIDIEDDGSFAWAVFRQDFGGAPRAIARRLVGSQWEAPAVVDGGGPAEAPRVAMSGRGVGAAVVRNPADGAARASLLELDAFGPSYGLHSGGSSAPPVVTASERDEQAVAWLGQGPDGAQSALARRRPARSAFEPVTVISTGAFGAAVPDGGIAASGDRLGDVAVAFVQAGEHGRRLVIAHWDRPPSRPLALSSTNHQPGRRVRLKWRPGNDLWGPQTFRVFVDDVEVGQTSEDQIVLSQRLPDGLHRWQVVAVDRRGQEAPMRAPRNLRIDSRAPRVQVRVRGVRRRGAPIAVRVRARDPRGGSGIERVRIDWGDGTRSTGRRAVHRYARAGRVVLTVRAVDRAGNVGRRRVPMRIG